MSPSPFLPTLKLRNQPDIRVSRQVFQLRAASSAAEGAGLRGKGFPSGFIQKTFAYLGFFVVFSGALVVAFFLYDASTYRDDSDATDIPVSEYALNPRRGGPKNLPIADHLVDDDDSPEKKAQKHKPKLVVLGTGWGSVPLLKSLNPDEYHVTIISPSNYFLFTPMLPSATVGTLELRSLVEPVRRITARIKGHFMKAEAKDVDFSAKLVEVASKGPNGEEQRFYVPYDKLVIGVGMYSQFFYPRLQELTRFRLHYESSRCQGSRELLLPQGHQRRPSHPQSDRSQLRNRLPANHAR